MVSKLKISRVLLALVLVLAMCSCSFAVKILYPGDTVKGKKLAEAFFCYSEKEQELVSEKLKTLNALERLLEVKERELAALKESNDIKTVRIITVEGQIPPLVAEIKAGQAREQTLTEEVKKRDRTIVRLNRKAKRNLFVGGLFGVGFTMAGAEVNRGR